MVPMGHGSRRSAALIVRAPSEKDGHVGYLVSIRNASTLTKTFKTNLSISSIMQDEAWIGSKTAVLY